MNVILLIKSEWKAKGQRKNIRGKYFAREIVVIRHSPSPQMHSTSYCVSIVIKLLNVFRLHCANKTVKPRDGARV